MKCQGCHKHSKLHPALHFSPRKHKETICPPTTYFVSSFVCCFSQTGLSSRWAKLHAPRLNVLPCVGTRSTADKVNPEELIAVLIQTLRRLPADKLSPVEHWTAQPGRSQLGTPHAVCPSEEVLCAWPCLSFTEWVIVSVVSDGWTVLLLSLGPSRDSKQTPLLDLATRLLVFPTHPQIRSRTLGISVPRQHDKLGCCRAGCTDSHEAWQCLQWAAEDDFLASPFNLPKAKQGWMLIKE